MRSGLLIGLLFTSGVLLGQSLSSVAPDSAYKKLTKWYQGKVGEEDASLYTGSLYPMISKSRYTHQFFEARSWGSGDLKLKGTWHFDVPMAFDLSNQQLIIKHPDLGRRDGIALNMGNVDEFILHDHHFMRLDNDQVFDLLHEGKSVSLLAYRTKDEKPKDGGTVYDQDDSYYTWNNSNGELKQLRGKGDLESLTSKDIKILSKELKKTKKAKLQLSNEEATVNFMKYFDEAINQ